MSFAEMRNLLYRLMSKTKLNDMDFKKCVEKTILKYKRLNKTTLQKVSVANNPSLSHEVNCVLLKHFSKEIKELISTNLSCANTDTEKASMSIEISAILNIISRRLMIDSHKTDLLKNIYNAFHSTAEQYRIDTVNMVARGWKK